MILLYHHVVPRQSVPAPELRNPADGWKYVVSPAALSLHLATLRSKGFRFVGLDELVEEIRVNGSEPTNAVALTFDDGWIDNYSVAYPILREFGCPATFFVTTDHLHCDRTDPKRMNARQLRALTREGMLVGGHTRTHRDLTRLSDEQAMVELTGCKRDLEDVLDGPVRFFAYPGGAFDSRVAKLTADAGFDVACSVLGPHSNDSSSLRWLFRDTLTESLDSLGDACRLYRPARRLLAARVRRALRARLGVSDPGRPSPPVPSFSETDSNPR